MSRVLETDLARIPRFCDQQSPSEMLDRVRVEHCVRGRTVMIVERRPPGSPTLGPGWTEDPTCIVKG